MGAKGLKPYIIENVTYHTKILKRYFGSSWKEVLICGTVQRALDVELPL